MLLFTAVSTKTDFTAMICKLKQPQSAVTLPEKHPHALKKYQQLALQLV